jgi:formylglycine-generating enzyme required for sulfatase activity
MLEEGKMKNQSGPVLVIIMFVVIPWAFEFTVAGDSLIPGDFEPDNDVDWADFAVLSAAWQAQSGDALWNISVDISDPNDGVIDIFDALVFSRHWLGSIPEGMVFVRGGEYEMGDHYNIGAPNEDPNHLVYVDSFCMDTYEVTNQQYCEFLNSALSENLVEVRTGPEVYGLDANELYCDTNEHYFRSRISWDGETFTVVAGKEDHPMVRVSWYGAVGYCNWRSAQDGRPSCYDLATLDTSTCDFSVRGYRLPTEAEWEYAARGGYHDPYYKYPWGNDQDYSKANWYESGDPYEPYTTPIGFYSPNGYGLHDMAGNVWEWCNDWYGFDYYSWSPYYNPRGPVSDWRRVFRGGCLQYDHLTSRVAHRGYATPKTLRSYGGFRVVVGF